ncbi:hypothetical protein N0V84_006748 [Fusarium piperis]|uniref:Uncharacterized protein n=1 Tax=Fusarium piperis TaxID=1435070 RepID=A0A9W8WBB2_9HYPO|nr:hypothetical protein N0V84_006748 [Fusarium piperis]
MSDQLPGTTVTNGRGEQECVPLFAAPGTAEEEVPLWQLFEAPVPESLGTSSVPDLTTATLDDV